MYFFCTYFDKNYLPQGIALFNSLKKHSDDFTLLVLCLDNETFNITSKLGRTHQELKAIPLLKLENWDKDLLIAKRNRSVIEYYFTLSPILPLYILDNFGDVDIVTYLDADLLFYSNPKKIYDELGDASILIVEHRFADPLKHLIKYGRFNVQYQSIRRDEQGMRCLNRWREQCLEWCYDYLEDGRYADQKYLDDWPDRYDQLVVSHQKGVGVAPWNIGGYKLGLNKQKFFVDDEKLIFYHFQGLKKMHGRLYATNLSECRVSHFKKNLVALYYDYLTKLNEASLLLGDYGYTVITSDIRHKISYMYFVKKFLFMNLILGPKEES